MTPVDPMNKNDDLAQDHPWLKHDPLTAKPDMLFGKRDKLGPLKLDADFNDLCVWFHEWRNKAIASMLSSVQAEFDKKSLAHELKIGKMVPGGYQARGFRGGYCW